MSDLITTYDAAVEFASAGYRRHREATRTLALRVTGDRAEWITLKALQTLVDDSLGRMLWGADSLPRTREVRDYLPDATPEEIANLLAARDPGAQRAAYRQNRRDRLAAAADAVRQKVPEWLAPLPPGRYPIGDVWAAWTSAVASSNRDDLASIGRTTFYAILAEVADVRSLGGHKRCLLVTATDAA